MLYTNAYMHTHASPDLLWGLAEDADLGLVAFPVVKPPYIVRLYV
jgi:hypothetical protein